MKEISIGKYRGLQQIASRRGVFAILALDHRQNLRTANKAFNDSQKLSDFKMEIVHWLAGQVTGTLLDPEFSAAQAIASNSLPGKSGLVVALESTGYVGTSTARNGQFIPAWSVEKAKRMGASAAKLLVYYHPESKTAKKTAALVKKAADACIKSDLVLMLEVLPYSLTEQPLSPEERKRVIVQSVRDLSDLGADLLKIQFPIDPSVRDLNKWVSACREITAASVIPWILLSAAVSFESYLAQVIAACQSGASGIAVGRAVWQEAVLMSATERESFLATSARDRIQRLTALTESLAIPFTKYYQAAAPLDWYKNYGNE